MEKMRQWGWLPGSIATVLVLVCFFSGDGDYSHSTSSMRRALRNILPGNENGDNFITTSGKQVVVNNGLCKITFSLPGGDVIGIQYKGIDNILEIKNAEGNRGYWDVVSVLTDKDVFDKVQGTNFKIINETVDQVEISFTKTYVASGGAALPINVDKRYIVQRGRPGFYAYAIFERLEGWPAMDISQIRIVYKLQEAKFKYMALTDTRQRFMPSLPDRNSGKALAYPEAVLLTNPSEPEFKGEVDDKYQYSIEDKDNKVHGWISTDDSVGFWMITPSDESRMAGPFKQDITSHAGPICLSMFVSCHYAGKDVIMKFEEGEAYKKVFGPVFVYLNSAPPQSKNSTSTLWNDAKQQMLEQVSIWPYNFTNSPDFPSSDQRGSVYGQLKVNDRYINESLLGAAYVGLAAPGEVGSWQVESKGYQFWTQADKQGSFLIKDVRPGNYNLYASVPGVIGDYKYDKIITITPGSKINLATITFQPPRNGPTLWEIGIPDRSAAEFYIPDPSPTLANRLYNNLTSDKFRQYGLWSRYSELYPQNDLVYDVRTSNYRKDWFYAHVTRNTGNEKFVGTTWQVVYELENVVLGSYTLQMALASATNAEVQVRINDRSTLRPLFTTRLIGEDNAIARHGIHGLYFLYSIEVPSSMLVNGKNTIYLTQARGGTEFAGVMYDYIRLEAPGQSVRVPK